MQTLMKKLIRFFSFPFYRVKATLKSIVFKSESKEPWTDLTILPGIGTKNCKNFFDAGFKSPEQILSASDKQLLSIPGVGISFIKRLRTHK